MKGEELMSANFYTTINVSGSKEGITKVLEVVRYYEKDRYKQYQDGEPYANYLEMVKVCEGKQFDNKKTVSLEDVPDIVSYVSELKTDEILIIAEGPYGRGFATLDEVDLYNDIAEKLDDSVEFDGNSEGFNNGGRQLLRAIYKNGNLKIDLEFEDYTEEEDFEEEDDVDFESIINAVKQLLPLNEFKKIFKIKGELLTEDYECIIDETMLSEEDFDDVFGDKEEFEEYINGFVDSDGKYTITDEDFKSGVDKLESLGIRDLMS